MHPKTQVKKGQIVLFCPLRRRDQTVPAIVTHVKESYDLTCALTVFDVNDTYYAHAPYSDVIKPGYWSFANAQG